jgi:HSP20 family protein
MKLSNELSQWTPFRELDDLQDRLKSLFLRSGDSGALTEGFDIADWQPAVDVSENDQEFTLTADLPNVPKDQLKVTVANGMLTIQGERKQEKEEKGRRFHRVERSYGKYCRSFRLPESVDPAKIDAAYADGVLTLHLPKGEEQKPSAQEIPIH